MRTISLLSFFVLLAASGTVHASEDERFALSGYYKNLLTGSKSAAGDDYSGDLNRLRLDGEYRPTPDAKIKLVLDNEVLVGSVLDTAEFKQGKGSRQTYSHLEWTFADGSQMWGRTSVHRLYLTAKSGKFAGTLGRQRIAWGTGRLWNPTDVFNPVSPLSIERDERTGTDAARFDLYPGPLSSITGVYAPELTGKDDVALRARSNMREYDVALVLASLNTRDLAGVEFAGNLGDASLRGELTRETLQSTDVLFPVRRSRFTRAVLSWDYTFTSTLYVLLEYLYNGGKVNQDVPLIAGQTEITTKNGNFFAAGFGYDLTPLIRPECTIILDVDGQGIAVEPSITYNVRENVDWITGAMVFRAQGEYREQHDLYHTSVKVYF